MLFHLICCLFLLLLFDPVYPVLFIIFVFVLLISKLICFKRSFAYCSSSSLVLLNLFIPFSIQFIDLNTFSQKLVNNLVGGYHLAVLLQNHFKLSCTFTRCYVTYQIRYRLSILHLLKERETEIQPTFLPNRFL